MKIWIKRFSFFIFFGQLIILNLYAEESETIQQKNDQVFVEKNNFDQNVNDKIENKPSENKQGVIEETVLGMNVTGNKEFPNVLYIIPWKGSSTPARPPAVSRLVDEIYEPVDPVVFRKQVDFYYQLTAKSESAESNKE